jgi:ABC-2 type transport system ATP-binding protein
VAGVARVISRDSRDGALTFEIEGLENYSVRPELARAVVQSGWNLTELRAVGESLEEIFLELTKSEEPAAASTESNEAKEVREGNTVTQ